jgi:hypothetical protein
MRVETESSASRARTATTAGLARLRRGSLAVLVLLVVEYAIGMYVNLYVTVPGADHGGSLGSAISNGPASLSVHAVIASRCLNGGSRRPWLAADLRRHDPAGGFVHRVLQGGRNARPPSPRRRA